MKKSILSILITVLFLSTAVSQVKTINIDVKGDIEIVITLSSGNLTLNSKGEILSDNTNESFEYYTKFESSSKEGKIKKAGSISFDYYTNFHDVNKEGKILKIGDIGFDYYTGFHGKSKEGKIRKVGDTDIDFYTSFNGEFKDKKVSKIGTASYDYYTGFDGSSKEGKLRSGNRKTTENGITFILRGAK